MDKINWLQQLADGCQCEPKQETINAYLEILEAWKLTDDQWYELRRRAILRHKFPRLLPMISELYDIAGELRQEATLKAGSDHLAELQTGERVPCPEELKPVFEKLKKQI